MSADLTPNPERLERVLVERARRLAQPEAAPPAGDVLELVVLALGAERYGLDIQYVQEIQPLAGLTSVPGLPPIWAGLINLRGHLYPVLDLRPYLSLPPSGPPAPHRKIVLVAAAGSTAGQPLTVAVLADEVLDLRRLPLSEIGPPLAGAVNRERQAHYVRGVTADWLTVLDLPALLADPALIVQEKSV
jgi:purine-binding chemotaxis protein CheW